MKIGFLGPGDPTDVRSYSGVPYFSLEALKRTACEPVIIDAGDQSWSTLTRKINNVSRRLSGKRLLAAEHFLRRRAAARRANAQIAKVQLDALICLNIDFLIPQIETEVPIIHNSDATFEAIANYYPSYADFWPFARARANSITQAALDKSARCSFPSEWAARSAEQDYGVPNEKISIIPYGANLTDVLVREDVLQRRRSDTCELLFIGGVWERKGGPVAYEVMRALRERGVDATLTVVGVDPGIEHPNLRKIGFLNKQIPEDLELYKVLWQNAHFLCMPSKAETFGAIYSEAAANAVPVIARDTGGISGCVKHATSGLLLAQDATVEEFVEAILAVWNDEARYGSLVEGARQRFEAELNWDVWAERMVALAQDAVAKRKGRIA